jgi:hypothetical protein
MADAPMPTEAEQFEMLKDVKAAMDAEFEPTVPSDLALRLARHVVRLMKALRRLGPPA